MHAYTAELISPILVSLPTLDALIVNQLTQKLNGDWECATEEAKQIITCENDLFHCSSAIIENPSKIGRTYIASLRAEHNLNSRDVILKNDKHPTICATRPSTYGAKMDRYTGIIGSRVIWFFDGDAKAIEQIMSNVFFIGKKHNSGGGELGCRAIFDSNASHISIKGEPLRPIPISVFGSTELPAVDASWKPAYWDFNNRDACVIPDQKYTTKHIMEMLK